AYSLSRLLAWFQFAGFAMAQQPELAARDAAGIECPRQCADGSIARLVGELERAPVDADRVACADVAMNLHRLGRIDMIVGHEPARLVGADGDQRKVEAPETATDFDEIL